jgi:hypothetical protein
MPFGLDTKSLVIGALVGALVVPRVLSAVAAAKSK